jgi:signal transduction histidine kinase/HAMP domain-containing protein
MLSIRGKLLIFALEIVLAVLLLFSILPWEADWARVGLGLLAILAVAFAVSMGRAIASALDRLVAATRRIGRGDYEKTISLQRSDEIGALAVEIDKMRVELREKVRQLEALSAGLERRVEERTAELTLAHDRLRVLHDVTNAVNASVDLGPIFDAVVEGTRRLVEFEGASIARIQESAATTLFVSGRAPKELGEPPLARILAEGRPVTFPGAEDLRALVLPLSVGQTVIGAWSLVSRRADAFGATELALLEPIASDLAVAFLRAEAFEREREAARSLKELSDLKSDFVSRVSHELRTPLTSILGALENLQDGIAGPLDAKALEYVGRMRDNGRRLLGLITSLLDLARIESGEEELRLERCELAQIVTEVLATLRPQADAHGVTLASEVAPDLVVVADRDKIARVVLNLVDNAIKFSDSGRRVDVRAFRDRLGAVEMRVIDGGAGIPAAEIDRIFDKFHRVRSHGRLRTPGSGLGLPICRELVTMHGGTLRAESTPGAGSTFIVTFPATAAARGAA